MEQAYEAARQLYAVDKTDYAVSAMFWTAVDRLKELAVQDQLHEALQIHLALQRLMAHLNTESPMMSEAMMKCAAVIERLKVRKSIADNGPLHLIVGLWGEELAVDFLRKKGYRIIERDWHSSHKDIDIIALDRSCYVFVEVKTRSSDAFEEPLSALDKKKCKNLSHAITHYRCYRKILSDWRFDVITIVGRPGSDSPQIEHLMDFAL